MKKFFLILLTVLIIPEIAKAITYDEIVIGQTGGHVLGSITSLTTYDAIADLNPRGLPPLPALGPAGSSIIDPTFGTKIYRVTDENTNPGYSKYRCRTSSGNELNLFNANDTIFYVLCGNLMFFRLNPTTREFNVIKDPNKPSDPLLMSTSAEPDFSLIDPNILYMSSNDKIEKYDFSNFTKSTVLDLKTIVPDLAGYSNNISNSTNGKLDIVFNNPRNGLGIDYQKNIVIYDTNTAQAILIDTEKATIDGQPFNIPFSFGIHGSKIDKSGRYINITPGVWFDSTNKPTGASTLIVDLQTKQAQWLNYRSGGHRALGYGQLANGEVPPNDYGPNILLRPLDFSQLNDPTKVVPLMPAPNPPPYAGGADYVSWNNAQQGLNVPVIGVFYQKDTAPKFNGEIFAAATDGSKTVWRFAHHRAYAGTYDGSSGSFWNLARGSVSQDGRFMLFMSNWEKTLGTVVDGDRTDVFLLELKQESSVVPSSTPPTDTTPPIILSIIATPTTTAATISWTTNENSDAQVDFGTASTSLNSASALVDTGSNMKMSHSVILSNITPTTTYYYRVKSKDSSGNSAISVISSFTTGNGSLPPSSVQRKLVIDPEGLSTNKTATGTIQFINTTTKTLVNSLPFTTNTLGEYTFSTPANLPSSAGLRIVVPGYLPRLVSNADLTSTSLITIPIPQLYSGDFNGDGLINSLDYSGLNQKWNQTTNITLQDINRDGVINSLDFQIIRNNWYRRGE